MEFAVHYPNFAYPGGTTAIGPTLAATARAADTGGVSDLTLMDHYFQIEPVSPRAEDPMLEGYTTLGYLAGLTQTVRLGLMVTGVTYRHPGLLAKIVATLDVLSGGRATLGIGAAWYDREHAALGVPYPPTAERFERLEEALRICLQMWSDDDGPFTGTYYQLAETMCSPRPLQQPRPPILIGGMGERKTLRLVARFGDACNLFTVGPDEIARKLEVLRGHCEAEGTDYDRIEKTIMGGPDPVADPDAFLTAMEAYAAVGITKVWTIPTGDDPAAWVSRAAEQVIPRLRNL